MTYLIEALLLVATNSNCLSLKTPQLPVPLFSQVRFLPMSIQQNITPIAAETRAVVDTATAAFHLNRRPQTLRVWACYEDGPIRPLRVNGRLAWPVADIRRLLGCFGSGNDSQYQRIA